MVDMIAYDLDGKVLSLNIVTGEYSGIPERCPE